MRKHYRNFNNRLFKQTDTIYYMWDEKGSSTVDVIGDELIVTSANREFGSGVTFNWVLTTVNGSDTNNDFNTSETTGSGATEGTYFTDDYLNIASTSDLIYRSFVFLDNAYINESSLSVGQQYRLSYSYEITAYTSGTLSVGFCNNDFNKTDVNKYEATASAQTGTLDFVYDGAGIQAKIGIFATTDSVFTAYFDKFSLKQIGVNYPVTKYIGIHPTPSTSSKTIRYHYVAEPTALSADVSVLEIDEDYEKAVVYGASAELSKRLRGLDFAEYDPMSQRLLAEFAVEKDKALRHSIDRDSERFVKVDYRDF